MKRMHIIVGCVWLLAGCYYNNTRVRVNPTYNGESEIRKILSCDLLVYSISPDEIRIYFSMNPHQFRYNRDNPGTPLSADLKFDYEVKTLSQARYTMVDSSVYYLKDVRASKIPDELIGYFNAKAPRGKVYKLKIIITDMGSGAKADKEYFFSLESANSPYLFINLSEGDLPSFQPKAYGDSVRAQSNAMKHKKLQVRYYNRNFGTAPPPFANGKISTFSYKADSVFTYTPGEDGMIRFRKSGNGFYNFRTDTTVRDGYTIYCFPPGYPKISDPHQMLEPLLFICSHEEYATLVGISDPRTAVENFWLQRSSSKERARQIIKQFYQRVEEANKEYTSFIEGWRTDRGMVHLIFGKPGYIQINSYGETWTYRTGMNGESLHFTFRKVENPFTDNDFLLDRNQSYKPVWYNAVENWRSGRVFKLNQF